MSETRKLRIRQVVLADGDDTITLTQGDEVPAKFVKDLDLQGALVPLPGEQPAEQSPSILGDYDSHKVEDLQGEADRRGLTVDGSGADGNVVKSDLVAALVADDAK